MLMLLTLNHDVMRKIFVDDNGNGYADNGEEWIGD